MTNDPIADMLTRIRNASARRRDVVEMPYSKNRESVAKVLNANGFIGEVKSFKPKAEKFKQLSIALNYDENGNAPFEKLERVSKPGLRQYTGYKEIKPVLGGFGVYIVSTSQGIMSSVEARKKHLGGELICRVY